MDTYLIGKILKENEIEWIGSIDSLDNLTHLDNQVIITLDDYLNVDLPNNEDLQGFVIQKLFEDEYKALNVFLQEELFFTGITIEGFKRNSSCNLIIKS